MYESPISMEKRVRQNIRESVDGKIYEAVLDVDVHVNRDELLRALRYDRDQYAKGYEDGKRDAERHGRWIYQEDDDLFEAWVDCSVCHISTLGETPYCPNCGAKMDEEGEA